MGALHAGHVALLERARKLAGSTGTVVASIFVNPTQFGPKEDLSRYPRTLAEDRRKCEAAGVDYLFAPEPAAMYGEGFSTWVEESSLSKVMCGASRPGHFRGVCTVVTKLFHLIAPDVAVFGKKDAQQLAIIRRMVADLDFQVRVVGVPTVRESDGLALSSRNRYLNPQERRQAVVLRRALLAARASVAHGERSPEAVAAQVAATIGEAPLAKIDYVKVVDAATLEPPGEGSRLWLIAVAVFFGSTRLIDNVEVKAGR